MIKMLKHNIAIHCNTLEKSEILIKYFRRVGYNWFSGSIFRETCWDFYEENTCYCLSDTGNSIQYSGIDYFKEVKFDIIEFEDFMKSVD